MEAEKEKQMLYVLELVKAERERQELIHGPINDALNLTDQDWFIVLMEEVGEVAKELCDLLNKKGNIHQLREELVQSAASAVAWLEALDLRMSQPTIERIGPFSLEQAEAILASPICHICKHELAPGPDGKCGHQDLAGDVVSKNRKLRKQKHAKKSRS